MIAPHGLLHSHINLRGATLVTFGPLWIVAHKIYRILEPQGLCIISDPIADIRDDMDFVNQFGALRNDGHICYYGEARLIELFEKAGLRVDTKFYSTITFPREFNEYYEKLLRKTPQALLDVYQVSQVGEKVHITLQVLNICFRKAASVV